MLDIHWQLKKAVWAIRTAGDDFDFWMRYSFMPKVPPVMTGLCAYLISTFLLHPRGESEMAIMITCNMAVLYVIMTVAMRLDEESMEKAG